MLGAKHGKNERKSGRGKGAGNGPNETGQERRSGVPVRAEMRSAPRIRIGVHAATVNEVGTRSDIDPRTGTGTGTVTVTVIVIERETATRMETSLVIGTETGTGIETARIGIEIVTESDGSGSATRKQGRPARSYPRKLGSTRKPSRKFSTKVSASRKDL